MYKKIFQQMAAITMAIVMFAGVFAVSAAGDTAVTYGTGRVQVDNVQDNVTMFNAFLIFRANKNADGTLSNFTWAGNEVRNAVLDAIKQYDPRYTSTSAQDAAEYISSAYTSASGNVITDQNTKIKSNELLNRIADAVDGTAVSAELTAGVQKELDEGYWLIVTDSSSIGVNESGTSPIFTISGGGPVTITEKTSVPRLVAKEVLDDADGARYGHGADAELGQETQYRITGTVAGNISTFNTYYYEFRDTMSKGLDYVLSSYKVTIDGTDVTSSFSQVYSANDDGSHTLSVTCSNIKNISGVSVNADSRIIMTYKVKLNNNCIVGQAGNPNFAKIIYSNNPNTDSKGETYPDISYLYTFELHLEKKDRDTNESLSGAKFTVEATSPDDAGSKGKYVQADGSLGNSPYEFTTGANGSFNISGLDSGTYTIHETKTPAGYQYINRDTKVQIAASYSDAGTLTVLTNTVSDNADAAAGTDNTLDIDDDNNAANIVKGEEGTGSDISRALVNVTVGNIKKIAMPLSGQKGIILMAIIGGLIAAVSLTFFLMIRKRRRTRNVY